MTSSADMHQFEVTFYSPDGKKINDQPILANSGPDDEQHNSAWLDSAQIPSNTLVSRLEITVVRTTDIESSEGVVLDIEVSTEPNTGETCRE